MQNIPSTPIKSYPVRNLVLAVSALLMPTLTSAASTSVISYWGTDSNLYNQLPAGSLGIINPDNGIFISKGQTTTLMPELPSYTDIVNQQKNRGVQMLAYVPTGYANHSCNQEGKCQTWPRIEATVKSYFEQMPNVAGIFFDEAHVGDCATFKDTYSKLRTIVSKYRPNAQIAFNTGAPSSCAVQAANAGEIVVLFEDKGSLYSANAAAIKSVTDAARNKGVKTWHLAHTVGTETAMSAIVNTAKSLNVDYVYVTDIGDWTTGANTWGSLPKYWASEVKLLSGTTPGLNWGNFTRGLQNASSGLCLKGNLNRIDQQTCSSSAIWSITVQHIANAPYYTLKYGGKCATQAATTSSALSLSTCVSAQASQLWVMRQGSQGTVFFENKLSGQVLGVDSKTVGSSALAKNYSGALGQLFYFY